MAIRRRMKHHERMGLVVSGGTYHLTLPWPPSINGYWRRSGYSTYISKGGKEFVKSVDDLLLGHGERMINSEHDIKFTAIYYPPTLARRDLDNLPKVMLDCLKRVGIYADDSQIRWIDIRFGPKVNGGRVDAMLQILDEFGKPIE